MIKKLIKEVMLDINIIVLLLSILTIIVPFFYWVIVGKSIDTLIYKLMKKTMLFNS
jgi:hypothetical protein